MRKKSKLLARVKKTGKQLGHFLLAVGGKFTRDECLSRSASLAYSTLLAIIPLAAFIFSILTAFGVLGELIADLQDFLIQILVPTKQDEFRALVETLVTNAQTLGVVGLVLFAVTSINLINNITKNLNTIWGSRPRSNYFEKFAVYTSTLLFGSMLIAVSLAGRQFLSSFFNLSAYPVWNFFLMLLPPLAIFLIFLFLIMGIPRLKVKLHYAAVGALAGAIAWEIAKWAFINSSGFIVRYSTIYGYLAIIPIFLFWLYILWIIIFAASELVYCLQYKQNDWKTGAGEELQLSQTIALGIQIYIIVARAFKNAEKPPSTHSIAKKMGISLADANLYARHFAGAGLLHIMGKRDDQLIPARSLDSITFKDLIGSLLGNKWGSVSISGQLKNLLKDIRQKMEESVQQLSLEAYLADEHGVAGKTQNS